MFLMIISPLAQSAIYIHRCMIQKKNKNKNKHKHNLTQFLSASSCSSLPTALASSSSSSSSPLLSYEEDRGVCAGVFIVCVSLLNGRFRVSGGQNVEYYPFEVCCFSVVIFVSVCLCSGGQEDMPFSFVLNILQKEILRK